jgi:hypothetical protein
MKYQRKHPKRRKIGKPKLLPFPKLMKKATEVFNAWIRRRDGNRCVCCGTTQNPTCGHLITAGKKSTRFDELNCHCQCRTCNYSHEFRPEIYTLWFIRKFGGEAYDDLVTRSNAIKKFTREELEEIIRRYGEAR